MEKLTYGIYIIRTHIFPSVSRTILIFDDEFLGIDTI